MKFICEHCGRSRELSTTESVCKKCGEWTELIGIQDIPFDGSYNPSEIEEGEVHGIIRG